MPVIDTFNGALTLNQRVFTELRDAPDGVRRGFLLILMVGLLVGVFQSASALISVADPARVVEAFRFGYRQSLEQQQAAATTLEQREVIRLLLESEDELAQMVGDILDLPTTLPRPIPLILEALGQAVSTPLTYLSGMLLAVTLTHLAARQLGGQGGIRAMVAVGSLSVAPHALDALTFIPVLSFPISMIAWGWGLIILISGTAVVHRLDSGKATLAVLLYPSLLIVLGILLSCVLGLLVVALAASV
ncbi:Yip1 family protein [uncultured Chloroflexus sp.]|uniref:Yip1 family protein n=1 Tax=uncultured Chloroflexus sp. TaxID=214040 RepID=UPI00261CD10F|nr:Yip1 family protein [uncultured Chloroflexus sp.]